ncbi:VOC family protein [Paenibacillus sp. VCA1]|uniref:VOC family protein n=1 Tax=Paenibacillus sp. VCA1 TaxID=3039148 RepID=UPI002871E640|nr:VOC family protein [Paenibacillus sp. VCA1]MDR9855475.1 VOC family protein [Paenibacillus sp. VCA1]
MKLKRIGIFVEEMKRALDFYRLLGFEIPASANEEQHIKVECNGIILAFDTRETVQVILGSFQEPIGNRMEIAFHLDSRETLDESYRRSTSQGYIRHLEPSDAPWGERYAIIKDPDGNLVSLVAFFLWSEKEWPVSLYKETGFSLS